LLSSSEYPLLNRAIQCDYPLGSVFKVVTASAGLDKGKVTPDKTFYCSGLFFLGGHIFRCWKEDGHGAVNIQNALKYSCNVYFYQLGRLVGGEDLANYSMKYGFGQPTGIDIPGEISGLVPNRMWKLVTKREPWYEGETINFAIGQGFLKVTPIQVARMMAAVANGGYLVEPHLVRRIEEVDIAQEKKIPVGVPNEIIDLIKSGLVDVVNAPDGTGKRAAIPGVTVAGKTGTAQTGTDKTHAWFSGFAPAEDPKYALVVLLEFGGKGGLRATQAAHDIFMQLKNLGYI
jgi:penicillin-binding protein 2